MQVLFYKTVVVGSGFAGRTVASYLNDGEYVVLERGEDREYGEIFKRFEAEVKASGNFYKAEDSAYGSDLPWNKPPQLSRWNYSRYAMLRGGSSNWWGGNTRRCSPATFSAAGAVSWPFTNDDMAPWYARAERRLNVSGDVANPASPAPTEMPGAPFWRTAFAPHFKTTVLSNVALNKGAPGPHGQGVCTGRSQCTICREDAKARPDNIFAPQHTLYESMVMHIEFDGARAVALECYDGKQLFRIEFERIVLACNGIETPRLLGRSELPPEVPRHLIGKYYQDHGHLDLYCKMTTPLPYGNVGGLAHVHLEDISTYYPTDLGDIEISAFALTHQPDRSAFKAGMDIDLLRTAGMAAFLKDLQGCFGIFCELEIPPQAGFSVDLDSDEPRILDDNYPVVIKAFDQVVREVCKKLAVHGVTVLGVNPKYRVGYNSHHLSGTMNCSAGDQGVVDTDMRVRGTANVYVAGSSVMPRAGGHGPTLTIVALAERLGAHLQAIDAPLTS